MLLLLLILLLILLLLLILCIIIGVTTIVFFLHISYYVRKDELKIFEAENEDKKYNKKIKIKKVRLKVWRTKKTECDSVRGGKCI